MIFLTLDLSSFILVTKNIFKSLSETISRLIIYLVVKRLIFIANI